MKNPHGHILLIIFILVLATGGWLIGRIQIERQRVQMELEQRKVEDLRAEVEEARDYLRSLRETYEGEVLRRSGVLAESARVSKQLEEADPEVFWVNPPEVWPYWDPASPYVWLGKDTLLKMSVRMFDPQGALRKEVGELMDLKPEQLREINRQARQLLAHYGDEMVNLSERVESPFREQYKGQPQASVRVASSPELAAVYRRRFEDLIRRETGRQRGDMILAISESWLNTHFNVSEDPKTYSLVRHDDGSYNLRIQRGSNYSSMGGQVRLRDYMPEPLAMWFERELGTGEGLP